MKQLFLCLITVIFSSLLHAQVLPITGPTTLCVGNSIVLSDATGGGVWSSSPGTVAVVGTGTGVVTGLTAGVETITYTVGASYVTHSVTVNASPSPITGPSSFCLGTTAVLYGSPSGGTWSVSPTTVATITPTTGVLTGISVGTATVVYTIATGCAVSRTVTVLPVPTPITGSTLVCVGGTTSLPGTSPPGGTWVSSSPSIATITSGGVITGVAVGTGTISYVLSTGCATSTVVTVTASPSTLFGVTGGGTYCAGGTGSPVGLAGSQVGVSYQLYNGGTPVGSPVAGTGSVISFGSMTSAGMYTVVANPGTACATTMTGSATISVNPLPPTYTVTGGGHYCAGGTGVMITLSGSSTGISYQLYNGTIPIGSPVPGSGGPVSFGPVTIGGTYTVVATNTTTGCQNNMTGSVVVVVDPLPVAYTVTGGGSYCSGGTGLHIGLSTSDAGVNYQLFLGSTAVGSAIAGTGASIDFGLITVAGTYTVVATGASTGCTSSMTGSAIITVVTVTTPTVTISSTPGTTVCPGTLVNYTPVYTGGGSSPGFAWTLNGVAVGTSSAYSVVPVTGDVVGVTLTSSDPCASPASVTATVVMTVGTPTVTATAATACGGLTTLTGGGAVTYSWSPSTGLGCSSCSSTMSSPTSSTVYTLTGTDAFGCTGTASVTVDANRISGYITYTGSSSDTFKVWLVQFNPSDSSILALDSVYSCMVGGTNPYYEFMDAPAGNYLVKAKLMGTTPGTSGYIPTYSLSTPNWYSAASVSHAAATDTMHINMVYGTVPPGPGFISGYVVSGAGRGTSGEVPESGMIVYLLDAVTGLPITFTYTDAAGTYTFTGLGYGSYKIAPEEYKYYTTVSDVIVLDAGSPSKSSVGFKKHTTFGNITPYGVENVAAVIGWQLSVFPNPAADELTISWPSHYSGGTTGLTLMDMEGRVALTKEVDMSTIGSIGTSQIGLSEIPAGVYHLFIKGNSLYFTSKLVVVH